MSYKGRTAKDPRLMDYAKFIAEKFRIDGPANIQCIRRKGRFYFVEVNPRFSGGLALTIKAGVNTPLMAVNSALGEPVKKHLGFKKNLHMIRVVDEFFC